MTQTFRFPMRSRRAPFTRVAIVLALVVASVGITAVASSGTTEDDLARAREQVKSAQVRADQAAARYEAAYQRFSELDSQVSVTRQAIADMGREAAKLEAAVDRAAVEAYAGGSESPTLFLGEDDVLDGVRKTALLDNTKSSDNTTLDRLGAIRENLDTRERELDAALGEQKSLTASLRAEQEKINDELSAVYATEKRLERQAATEAEARRVAASLRRAQASSRSSASSSSASRSASSGESGGSSAPVPGASIVCPIRGPLSFVDSWGAPRSGGRRHQGVDLMSPSGTPNVAVVSGSVSQKSGGLSGNGVYLAGDDGNAYWYFHLSAYEGGSRHVSQGETIGYTGNTGNASGGATHTHFEYHPGGGSAVNPYPIVARAC